MDSPSTRYATVQKAMKKAVLRRAASARSARPTVEVMRDISGSSAAATLVAKRATGSA